MKTLKIENNDFVLSEESFRWEMIEGDETIRQRISHRLKMFANEWFLDTSQGVDWFGIFEKPFSRASSNRRFLRVRAHSKQLPVSSFGMGLSTYAVSSTR